jgi:hypothetical protein
VTVVWQRRRGTRLGIGVISVAALAGLVLAARSELPDTGPPIEVQPASVATIPGSSVHAVTLTALAAQRLAVQTVPVAAAPVLPTPTVSASAVPMLTAVPTTALVYDPAGLVWVYTTTGPLTYVRIAVDVDHVAGDEAILRAGPPIGTAVVFVGAQELLGTEYGVGEE